MEVSDQLYPQGKSPWYSLDRRLGGPQSRSRRGGLEKNSQHPPGNRTPIVQPKSLLRNVTQGLGNGPIASLSEHGNEPSGSIKEGEFALLSDYRFSRRILLHGIS
jgi:hypothetical protein